MIKILVTLMVKYEGNVVSSFNFFCSDVIWWNYFSICCV